MLQCECGLTNKVRSRLPRSEPVVGRARTRRLRSPENISWFQTLRAADAHCKRRRRRRQRSSLQRPVAQSDRFDRSKQCPCAVFERSRPALCADWCCEALPGAWEAALLRPSLLARQAVQSARPAPAAQASMASRCADPRSASARRSKNTAMAALAQARRAQRSAA